MKNILEKDIISAYGRLLEYISSKRYSRLDNDFTNDPVDLLSLKFNKEIRKETGLDIFELKDLQSIIRYEDIVDSKLIDFTYKNVIKANRVENLHLREEHGHIERNPINRLVSDADLNAFQEVTIELIEHTEILVVNKEARVVEEITLDKEVTERDEVVRDTVRKTEVDVDNLGTTERRRNARS